MGTTLREVVYTVGGGMRGEGQFKAVQIGGPSGGCLTEEDLDLPLDFDSLKKVGAMIGSGGLVVMNDKTCMVEVARFFMHFTQNESCGKCTPCREGTKRMLEVTLSASFTARAKKATSSCCSNLRTPYLPPLFAVSENPHPTPSSARLKTSATNTKRIFSKNAAPPATAQG